MSAFRVRPQEDPLERERREIAARRERVQQRTVRVLHPKTRLFGIDTLALNQQVQEKQERERLEAERDLYYDDLSSTFSRAMGTQDSLKAEHQRRTQSDLLAYRKAQTNQKRRQELSERAAADELCNVPTDFLKFGGEDLGAKDRNRAQKIQQQDWLAQQIEDLQAREQRDQQEQTDYESMQNRISSLQEQQQNQANFERKRAQRELVEYNKQMASSQRSERVRESQMRQAQDDEELDRTLSSSFLNEGINGGNATNFKGFTTEQRQTIMDEQKQQLDDLRNRRMAEAANEREYAQQQEDIRRAMVKADRAKIAFAKQKAVNLAQERHVQAKEKTLRYDYLDNVVYTNPAQSEFFDQFGRDCR